MAKQPTTTLTAKIAAFDDEDLPGELRISILGALFAAESAAWNSASSDECQSPSPKKKKLMKQQAAVSSSNMSETKKDKFLGLLLQNYLDQKAVSFMSECQSNQSLPEAATNANATLHTHPTTSNKLDSNWTKTDKFLACMKPLPKPITNHASIGTVNPVLKSTRRQWKVLSSRSFEHRAAALTFLGPCSRSLKTEHAKSTTPTHIETRECSMSKCQFKVRLISPINLLHSGPCSLEILCDHTCQNPEKYTWEWQYQQAHLKKRGKPYDAVLGSKITMPPMVQLLTDQLSKEERSQPKQVQRSVSDTFKDNPIFLDPNTKCIIEPQIQGRVRNQHRTSTRAASQGDNIGTVDITMLAGIVRFREAYRYCLPTNWVPVCMTSEIHLSSHCNLLLQSGHLRGKSHIPGHPHRDMVCINHTAIQSDSDFLRILNNKAKVCGKHPFESTLVFSSISLLSTLCTCEQLDWEVMGSCDSTHNISTNDYKLLTFGVYQIQKDGTRHLKPIIFAWAEGEREIVSVILFKSMLLCAKELFGLESIQFRGGLVSDHSDAIVNPYRYCLQGKVFQCYQHLARKFRTTDGRPENGEYRKKIVQQPHKKNRYYWLANSAYLDVQELRLCRTQAMFAKMLDMVLTHWRHVGEEDLADNFATQYGRQPYNNWWYGSSCIPGCTPQQQAIERFFLDVKGCTSHDGIIRCGKTPTETINVSFPKLIWRLSFERTGVERNFPMLDEEFIVKQEVVLLFFREMDHEVDRKEYNGGYLVNTEFFFGVAIDLRRIERYEQTMLGKFTAANNEEGNDVQEKQLTWKDRREFMKRVNCFCHVSPKEVVVDGRKKKIMEGSCFHYYDKMFCTHAAAIMYQKRLTKMVDAIPQKKKEKATPKQMTALDRVKVGSQMKSMRAKQSSQNEKHADIANFLSQESK